MPVLQRGPFSFRQATSVGFPILVWVACLSVMGCVPRREKNVVVYCATDREYATPILDSFERSHEGTEIARQFDVESSKTLGLVTRIESERDRTRCDVFWNNEIIHTIRLQKKGLLRVRRWPVPDNWPDGFKARDGSWIGFAARARVLVINVKRLPDPQQWPASVLDLASERWHHRCGMAYPLYGTTATHMAVMASHPQAFRSGESNGPSTSWNDWIGNVAKHSVILAGNKQVALAVSSGELDWGITDTDDAAIELGQGRPIRVVYPDQGADRFGTLFIPNTICVLQSAPNPTAASQLADFLISEKIESRLTMANQSYFPVWPKTREAPDTSRTPESAVRSDRDDAPQRWASVDFEQASEAWNPPLIDRLKSLFDR